ncbi:hypothetical protein K438DRAFT_1964958 [Mycena galopus ATCC 62051]|nr:hypothetical protein K438DRAFT_1964958 [Mycena galopus ATCC 62051]
MKPSERFPFIRLRMDLHMLPIYTPPCIVPHLQLPVYAGLPPAHSGRHPDYDRMTSSYLPFTSVLLRLNVPVFSGMLRLISDFIRPFGR